MNIQEYISTGVLEAYVLGELSAIEKVEVEKQLALYAELRQELALIEQTSENLLMQLAISPRASLKTQLFEKINQQPAAKSVLMMPGTTKGWQYATAASVTIALFASFLAYNYWGKWKQSETNLTTLIAQNRQMAQDYNTVNQRLDKMEADIQVTNNPAFTRVVMTGTPNAPEALASVYWHAQTKEVYVSIQHMKQLAKDKQYQLWAIIDGKPVDCGVFDGELAGLVKMKGAADNPTTFAVTIETRGGKRSPSLETMQVAGTLAKG